MIIEHIISFLAPHVCISCHTEGSLLCKSCTIALPNSRPICYRCGVLAASDGVCAACRSKTPLTSVTARTAYAGTAKDLLWKLKFDRAAAAALPIAQACLTTAPPVGATTVITYVPTATSRVRQRGYDQSRCIARHVAKCLQKPMYPLLGRTSGVRQVGTDADTRRRQLAHAFRARSRHVIQNAHILLIDDVITTGSSLEAAARVLLEAGAARVDALAFAQASMPANNSLVFTAKAGIITSVR